MRHSIVIGLAVLLLAAPAAGEIYRWVDEQGRMHFAQALHDVPERYRAQAGRLR
jgi:hypothetical protein